MSNTWVSEKEKSSKWFADLRDQICTSLEDLEVAQRELNQEIPPGRFQKKEWVHESGGGGTMAILKEGRVFEKAGVNISTVFGEFSEVMRAEIPGADKDPRFWASGISLVIHPRNPHVPIVHMNTRMIVTTKLWFGGGGDLTPVFPDQKDTFDFHQVFKNICDSYEVGSHEKFKKWCDDYFFLPHRNEARGVGGIFYDYVNSGNWAKDFEFTKQVGLGFLKIYPEIVKRHYETPWTETEKKQQLQKRGRYVEFNLLYDRGTQFGLKTGGNTEAILMSMPPVAQWM